ncbi:MAG: alpha/beta hydrolase [Acidimicrobiales bacterium]|nr:alpha/beta hydrolase [Acidimicrobiales bacterium]
MRTPTRSRSGRVLALFLAGTLLAVSACGDDGEEASPVTQAPSSTAIGSEPVFESVPCDGELFAPPRLPEDRSGIECGTLTVPADRTDPEGGEVVLPVAVVRATQPDPEPDPIVFLHGGPGSSAFDPTFSAFAPSLAVDRDVILFDQRGAGMAEPSLNCPEVEDALFGLLETTDSPVEEKQLLQAAYGTCLDRLRAEGVDLNDYDTPTTVADLEDLRVALGVEQWNLLGVSYGGQVALEALRTRPEAIRSVVLDAPVAPFGDFGPAGLVANSERGFETVFAQCAEDPACAAVYPDLAATLAQARDRFDESPYEVSIVDPSGTARDLRLTGEDAVWAFHKGQYLTPLLPLVPSLVARLANGDPAVLDLYLSYQDAIIATSDGAYATVTCADRAPTTTRVDLEQLRADEPLYSAVLVDEPLLPDLCEGVDVEPVEEGFDSVGTTDVRVLAYVGTNDPRIAPDQVAEIARLLGDRATVVALPGIGHIATGAHPCPDALLLAFVDDPIAPLDTACVDEMGPPVWAL